MATRSASAAASIEHFRTVRREREELRKALRRALNDEEARPDQVVSERLPSQTPELEPQPRVRRGYEHRKKRR